MIKIAMHDETEEDNEIGEYRAPVVPHEGESLWIEEALYHVVSVSHLIHDGMFLQIILKVAREPTRP